MQVSVRQDAVDRTDFTANVTFVQPGGQPWRIDWGDGTISSFAAGQANASHTYSVIGPHEITVVSDGVSITENVFAGDYPAWDPTNFREALYVVEARKAAHIGATTGVLNG